MEEFKTAEQVEALFSEAGFETKNGQYFVGYDTQTGEQTTDLQGFLKKGTLASGAEGGALYAERALRFPFSGLLVAFSDKGIACIQLGHKGLLKTVTKADKLMVMPEMPLIRIDKDQLLQVTIKNYSILASKTKIVTMAVSDGTVYRLMVNTVEKDLPYQKSGFAAFMENYGTKK